MTSSDDQAQKPERLQCKQEEPYPGKPDATPREWTLHGFTEIKNKSFDYQETEYKERIIGPKIGDAVVHVIEKSAYLALTKEIEEMKVNWKALELEQVDHLDIIYAQHEKELAEAQTEVEREKRKTAQALACMDEAYAKLAKAQAEIEKLKGELHALK